MAVERRGAAIEIANLRKEYQSARGHVPKPQLDLARPLLERFDMVAHLPRRPGMLPDS